MSFIYYLSVEVIKAELIRSAENNGKSAVYVAVHFPDSPKTSYQKTRPQKKSRDLTWNQSFALEYNTSRDQPFIELDLWDHDTFGKDEFLGYASVNIGKLIEEQEEDVEFSLELKQKNIIEDIKKKKIIEPINGALTVKISVRLKVPADQTPIVNTTKIFDSDRIATTEERIDQLSHAKKRFIIRDIDSISTYRAKFNKYWAEAVAESHSIKQFKLYELKNETINKKSWRYISGAIINNKSITKLFIERGFYCKMENIYYIRIMLNENPRITYVSVDDLAIDDKALRVLSNTLARNDSIKTLVLKWCEPHRASIIVKKLKRNESLTELYTDYTGKHLFNLLLSNKNIKTLKFGPYAKIGSLVSEPLKVTKTLQTLDIFSFFDSFERFEDLIKALKVNKSLKNIHLHLQFNKSCKNESIQILANFIKTSKAIRTVHVMHYLMDVPWFSEALRANRSLTSLNISVIEYADSELLCDVLQHHQSIKSLSYYVHYPKEHDHILKVLAENNTITELNYQVKEREISHENRDQLPFEYSGKRSAGTFWRQLEDILQRSNRSLSKIRAEFEDSYFLPKGIELYLQLNEVNMKLANRNAVSFVRMMVLRQEAFFSILPIEIWLKILHYIPGAGVDLRDMLLQELSDTNKE